MRPCPLLLRILLAVALVLNGIAGAVAGVAAALPSAAAHDVALEAAMAPCSGGHDVADAPAMPDPLDGDDCHSHGGPACGDTAECRQACMHASVAVPTLPSLTAAQRHADAVVHPLASGHPPPPLPGPIRPPIA